MSPRENSIQQEFVEAVVRSDLTFPFNRHEVVAAFFCLAEQLTRRITEYDLVVGDDSKGRLPALVLGRVVANARQAVGLDKPTRRFAHGGNLHDNFDALRPDFIPEPKSNDDRTLIVTEGINQGFHVRGLFDAAAMKRNPGTIDVATVGLIGFGKRRNVYGADLYIGEREGDSTANVFIDRVSYQCIGVLTNRQAHARAYELHKRETLRSTRHSIYRFADMLTDHVIEGIFIPPYPEAFPDIQKVLV